MVWLYTMIRELQNVFLLRRVKIEKILQMSNVREERYTNER